MKKFRGQNVLDHRSNPNVPLRIFVSILALVCLGLLFVHFMPQPGATVTVDNYKVKLVYETTWDNYCLNPRLEVTNLSNHSRTNVLAHSYQGPCGHNHPASFWMKTGDFNHDGHKDFAVLSAYDVSAPPNSSDLPYTQFIYTPSAGGAMPFVQQ